jgi:hypothetical protein
MKQIYQRAILTGCTINVEQTYESNPFISGEIGIIQPKVGQPL